jgi:hypothetical protein
MIHMTQGDAPDFWILLWDRLHRPSLKDHSDWFAEVCRSIAVLPSETIVQLAIFDPSDSERRSRSVSAGG